MPNLWFVLCYSVNMLRKSLVLDVGEIAANLGEILEELQAGREVILTKDGEPAGVIEPWEDIDLGELAGTVLWAADDLDKPNWEAWGAVPLSGG